MKTLTTVTMGGGTPEMTPPDPSRTKQPEPSQVPAPKSPKTDVPDPSTVPTPKPSREDAPTPGAPKRAPEK